MRGTNTMAEGGEASTSTASASTSELSDNLLKKVAKIFAQVFPLLFVFIGFAAMNTSMAKSPHMIALVFMVVLYYLVFVIILILQKPQIRSFLPTMVILLLGSIVWILELFLISPPAAWFALAMWIFIFALVGYYNRQELYRLTPKRIKNLIKGLGGGAMSTPNSELPITESQIGNTQNP